MASAVGYPFPNSKVPRRVWTVSVPIQPCASVSCQFGVSRAVLLDRASTPKSLTPRCVREIAARNQPLQPPLLKGVRGLLVPAPAYLRIAGDRTQSVVAEELRR